MDERNISNFGIVTSGSIGDSSQFPVINGSQLGLISLSSLKNVPALVSTTNLPASGVTTAKIPDGAIIKSKIHHIAYGFVGNSDLGGGYETRGQIKASGIIDTTTTVTPYRTATASGVDIPFGGASNYVFTATRNDGLLGFSFNSVDVRGVAITTLANTVRVIYLNRFGNNASAPTDSEDYCFSLIGYPIN